MEFELKTNSEPLGAVFTSLTLKIFNQKSIGHTVTSEMLFQFKEIRFAIIHNCSNYWFTRASHLNIELMAMTYPVHKTLNIFEAIGTISRQTKSSTMI